jgi:hypothetical protein
MCKVGRDVNGVKHVKEGGGGVVTTMHSAVNWWTNCKRKLWKLQIYDYSGG